MPSRPCEDCEGTGAGAFAAEVECGQGSAAAAAIEDLLSMEALASASGKLGREDAESVMAGIRDTCGLSSDARAADIAADVLEKLLPDETVKLPEVECVGGGVAYRALKRAFDVCACALALVVMAIPMLVIAARIRRESPGPAIYAQEREGLGGRPFKLYKFRSMYADAEERGARWAASGDPRVTPYGAHLRRTRMASVIIGTPGDGESTKSLPRSANSSLDLQLCERRPGLCCIARPIITYLIFLSSAFFGGQVGVLKRSLRAVDVVSDGRVCAVAQTACAAVPLAEDWTVAA